MKRNNFRLHISINIVSFQTRMKVMSSSSFVVYLLIFCKLLELDWYEMRVLNDINTWSPMASRHQRFHNDGPRHAPQRPRPRLRVPAPRKTRAAPRLTRHAAHCAPERLACRRALRADASHRLATFVRYICNCMYMNTSVLIQSSSSWYQ
jgi:hypothetical protein